MTDDTYDSYLAKLMLDGECVSSAMRSTAAQAVAAIGPFDSGAVEVYRVEMRRNPQYGWGEEVSRTRIL